MANGRDIGRFEAALGVVGLLALSVTYVVATGRNPLPAVQNWLNRSQTLAQPAPGSRILCSGAATSSALSPRDAVESEKRAYRRRRK